MTDWLELGAYLQTFMQPCLAVQVEYDAGLGPLRALDPRLVHSHRLVAAADLAPRRGRGG